MEAADREKLSEYYRERFKHMRKKHPGFHPDTVGTHLNVIRTSDMIWRALGRYLRPHGLTPPAMGILLLLDSLPEPIPMSHLGEQMVVTQANITGLINTLEKGGWVRRTSHPSDRRIHLVEITRGGGRKIRAVWPGQMKLLKSLYAGISKEERSILQSVLEKIRRNALPFLGSLLLLLSTTARAQEGGILTLRSATERAIALAPSLGPARAALEGALGRQLILLGSYDTSLSAAIKRLDAKTPPAVFFQTPRTVTDSAGVGVARRFSSGSKASADASLAKDIDDVSSTFTINPRVRSRLNLTLSQTLLKGFVGRPQKAELQEAELTVRSARADLAQASERLAQEVSAAYWALWLGRMNKKVLVDSQEEAREFLETTKKLHKRFEAEKDDLLRAEASLLSKELAVLQAEENILARSESLRVLLVLPEGPGALENPAPPGETPQEQDALARARLAREDLAARRLEAQRDRLHLAAQTGLGLPTLDLAGSLGWSGLKDGNTASLHQLNRAGFRTWSIGLDLSYAIGARSDQGLRRLAESSVMLSDSRTRDLDLAIEREVRTALARLRLAKQRVEISRRLEDMQVEALEISRNKYQQARISSQDRLAAADIALSARGARIQAEADAAVAEAAQKASVGELQTWLGVKK